MKGKEKKSNEDVDKKIERHNNKVKLLTGILTLLSMVLGGLSSLVLNNTFELEVKTSRQEGLGTSYVVYELQTEPPLANAKLGLQAYVEIIYEEEILGRILVNDLYGSNAYNVEDGKALITCKADKMKEYCRYLEIALCESYDFDKERLKIKQDTIIGFSYTILRQNFEVPRYFRLNDNNPLHISRKEALCIINETEEVRILMEGNLDELMECEPQSITWKD